MPMKKIFFLIFILVLTSCIFFKEKQEYTFEYEFENEITQSEIKQTINVLNKRLNRFGIEHDIKKEGRNTLSLKLRAYKIDTTRVNNLIVNQGKLEFWELYNGDEFGYNEGALFDIKETETENNFDVTFDHDIIFSKYKGAPEILKAHVKDTSVINMFLNKENFTNTLAKENRHVKFLWGVPEQDYLPLYAAKPNAKNKASLTGKVITNAIQSFGYTNRPEISIEMNEEGALIWERITGDAFANNTKIAIVLNDVVYSAPSVTSGPIAGGRSQISGNFTIQQAQDLAIILSSSGSVPKLRLVNK